MCVAIIIMHIAIKALGIESVTSASQSQHE